MSQQQEIEYFGGPSDGRAVNFRDFVYSTMPPNAGGFAIADLTVICKDGYYQPERLPSGTWRLHFYSTANR